MPEMPDLINKQLAVEVLGFYSPKAKAKGKEREERKGRD